MEWIIAFIFMTVCAAWDIKTKTIPISAVILFGIITAVCTGIRGNRDLLSLLYSLIPGALLLTLSLCTRESIGYGDGLLVLPLGILIGLSMCIVTVVSGMIISAVCALVLLVCKKVNGKTRMPFVPFMTMGLGVAFVVGNLS